MFKLFISAGLFFLTAALCPEGSFEWQNNCYFFQTNSSSFADAESTCDLLGEKGETVFCESTVTDFWIGLTNSVYRGTWTWMDGTSFVYSNWDFNEPKNITSSNCAALSVTNSQWRAHNCYKMKPYVCKNDKNLFEITTTTTTTTTTVPTTTTTKYPSTFNCTFGFFYFAPTHSCFGLGTYFDDMNWTDSEQACAKYNAHLPSVHSYEELQLLKSFTTVAHQYLWIGGFTNDGGIIWQWSDGTPWDYTPWMPNNDTAYNCVEIDLFGVFNYPCSNTNA